MERADFKGDSKIGTNKLQRTRCIYTLGAYFPGTRIRHAYLGGHKVEMFTNDWASYLLGVLTPYYCEQLMYAELMSVLW
jgi:hypothetical protein